MSKKTARIGERRSFAERTVADLHDAIGHARSADESSKADGALQRLDPRVKVVGLLSLILAAALAVKVAVVLEVLALAVMLALVSRVRIVTLATRVWLGALLFSGLIAVPAIFITPGQIVGRLPILNWPVTEQGLRTAALLTARVETAATLSLLLIFTTPWTDVLKALRALRVPAVFVVILGMTYRYIFLMIETARAMFESRRSRMVGVLAGPDRRRLAAASVGVLLGKSFQLSDEVYLAMRSRGFRGEVDTLDDFRMRLRDWACLIVFFVLASLAFWQGH
jgi:cobalt/nickel transport system permease protein